MREEQARAQAVLAEAVQSARGGIVRLPLKEVYENVMNRKSKPGVTVDVVFFLPETVKVGERVFRVYLSKSGRRGVHVWLLREDVAPFDYLVPVSDYVRRLLSLTWGRQRARALNVSLE